MSRRIKSPSQVKTISSIVDHRRSRTPHGALLELAMLETERQRLLLEQERMANRDREIQVRLEAIHKKSERLYQFVERGEPLPAPEGNSRGDTPPELKIRTRTLSY
ncbi:hypothetical protein [Ectothiorhodospira variabilis]|uniref:hypothetical protein n=1 Tax=Ectothiorhodospira variabilis TaxID=505694 RepID=UPI001EFBDCC7|nr:hypothetical protein [Ectothiorhodospira variabilis]MCG5495770.1 hypothetical protein [Ectothiorhodospira variabilis]MCG5498555.1 hypothetical protein [Ectothiorhodospira variabilis]MCG5505203.1 hypothetical protein [Ectothiorhodospira variabilis]MCG5508360.1 hypothetical protein [Ectothiorhodospira variabilis]